MKPERIILRQYKDILELRHKMSCFLNLQKKDVRALFVGEGVQWTSTFLGFCLIHNKLPANINNITVIDLNYQGESTFYDQLIFEGFENTKIESLIEDATNMNFNKSYFDLIVAPLMIDDCDDHLKLLTEFKRCLKPKGRIILSGHGIDSNTTYKHIPDILGQNHYNQTTIESITLLLNKIKAKITYSWKNDHCWLNVFEF